MGDGPKLPGQEIERAAANVAEDAGKSLTGALRTVLSAWASRAAAVNAAEAEEIKKDIAHEREAARLTRSIAERRRHELSEIDHQNDLLARGMGRTLDQIFNAQASVEYVGNRAIALNAHDPEKRAERDVEQDWLRRFFKYVADVDEAVILDVFAQALNDSAIRGRAILSPRALDTLRFFEKHTFDIFIFCANLIGAFDSVPRGTLEKWALNSKQDLDLPLLVEMGLIKSYSQAYYLVIVGNFRLSIHYDVSVKDEINLIRLTHVGRSIAGLINRAHRKLGDPLTFSGSADELLDLQLDLGVDEAVVRDLGNALLSEVAISQEIEVEVLINARTCLFKQEKRKYDDPFGLSAAMELPGLSPRCLQLARELIEPFEEFDRRQVRGLKRQN